MRKIDDDKLAEIYKTALKHRDMAFELAGILNDHVIAMCEELQERRKAEKADPMAEMKRHFKNNPNDAQDENMAEDAKPWPSLAKYIEKLKHWRSYYSEEISPPIKDGEENVSRDRVSCQMGRHVLDIIISELQSVAAPSVPSSVREALTLIAAPKRADGTYNRCREACEQLARQALKDLEEGE